MKIAIVTPCHGDTRALYTFSLAQMLIAEAGKHEFYLDIAGGSDLAGLRNQLIERALEANPDYLLLIDSDHGFPADTLARLLERNVDIVGCNFLRRHCDRTTAQRDGRDVPHGAGLEQVDTLGLGICLIRADVFAKAPKPWFVFGLLDSGSTVGEDRFFFTRLRNATGIRPYVDHDLSARVSHLALVPLYLGREDDQLRLHPRPPTGNLDGR